MPPSAHQSETAVERLSARAAFLEHIGEGPERHHRHQPIALRDIVSPAPARHTSRVARTRRMPGTFHSVHISGKLGMRRSRNLPVHFLRSRGITRSSIGMSSFVPNSPPPCRRRSRGSRQNPPARVLRAHASGIPESRRPPQSPVRRPAAADSPPSGHARCDRTARSTLPAAESPLQKSMFGSFHTSKYHCATSSIP